MYTYIYRWEAAYVSVVDFAENIHIDDSRKLASLITFPEGPTDIYLPPLSSGKAVDLIEEIHFLALIVQTQFLF